MATPRTASRPPNRLARETSPYLLQHAHNPVDWYAWGPEAFEAARSRDVPIFLSVGYSTCYWCHVMERESFESERIGELMSRLFVCVKVDREERPDVDDVYMAAVQAFTGRGGWPMSVFLEPASLKPFWAGTYYPAEPTYAGVPAFPQVLEGVSAAWRDQREEVLQQADELAEAVRERTAEAPAPVQLSEDQVTRAAAQLLRLHDRTHGGFGPAPKFPQPVYLELLLDTREAAGDDVTRQAIDAAVVRTLDAMALGGMFDQVGGGFHRYSVDEKWLVPHFEKMLYDNAQLAALYARAARVYSDAFYERIARRTVGYLVREMRSPEGAFFSAQDAEVNAREGQNYLWTREQVEAALPPEDAAFATKVYGLDRGPNFRDPHHPDEPPSNVLFLADRPARLALAIGAGEAEFLERLDRVNAALYAARARRPQPGTDDKALAGWNGLAIAALASASRDLGGEGFVNEAKAAADFVLTRMREPDGRLRRSYRAGRSKTDAFLEDYAFVTQGLLELHALEAAGAQRSTRWLDEARRLVAVAEDRFRDPAGGYFDVPAGASDLFVRTRSAYDGALPSGTSAMLHNLIDLSVGAGDGTYRERALRCLASVSGFLAQAPLGAANSTRALLRLLTLAPGSVRETFAGAPQPAAVADAPDEDSPVQVLSTVESVDVGADDPGGLVLRVEIAEGFHVAAADPGSGPDAAALVPFRVHVVNGAGVRACADYPKGEPHGPGGELRVYRGAFEFPVVIERTGEWAGRPLLAVTYQPCTETECRRPRTVELAVAVDRK